MRRAAPWPRWPIHCQILPGRSSAAQSARRARRLARDELWFSPALLYLSRCLRVRMVLEWEASQGGFRDRTLLDSARSGSGVLRPVSRPARHRRRAVACTFSCLTRPHRPSLMAYRRAISWPVADVDAIAIGPRKGAGARATSETERARQSACSEKLPQRPWRPQREPSVIAAIAKSAIDFILSPPVFVFGSLRDHGRRRHVACRCAALPDMQESNGAGPR